MKTETEPISHKEISKERIRKHVNLSKTTVDYVTEYAEMIGIPFSRAVEGLLLKAIGDTDGLDSLTLMRDVIRHEMLRGFNRFAKLHAFTAMESGTAKETISAVWFWTLLERYKDYEDQLPWGHSKSHAGFQKSMRLKKDDIDTQILLAEFERRTRMYRDRALEKIRLPLPEELEDLLSEFDAAVNETCEE